ncbi:hypothetical protein FYK55_16905 [Roseiconus nitratireducens]|uniref:YcxB-like protein domain-containing protein n=1 Tax=Roseiconus nitratireducens TaxID=2605748 RepID=A0A5M6D310_9BACT|nr:hypothetical protein [Roseiconus nitratireducens]KAA5541878.1 hypothetical protein FYK55_16905 [Roseiconus nitratireducens]
MINPYQAPPDQAATFAPTDAPVARFRLDQRMIRYAESKFLLWRCGGRVTLASMVMIALALGISLMPPVPGPIGIAVREVVVMGLATVIYLTLIRGPRNAARSELAAHGVVSGAEVEVSLGETTLIWCGPAGTHRFPLESVRLMTVGKGLIVIPEQDLYLFVPRRSDFGGASYGEFVKLFRARVQAASG